MGRCRLLALGVAAALISGAGAAAQPSAPDNGDGRYTFHRADNGYIRLDGRTGQVSICNRHPSGWQCRAVPDERAALEAEIARLQNDNAALKKELLIRNLALPRGIRPDAPTSSHSPNGTQSHDGGEVSRVVTVIGRAWRRLVEMIASVQRDLLKRI